jgi:hypothetical protein
VDARTGALLPWAPTADAAVLALAVDGGTVYVGGDFGTVNGQHRDSLAGLDRTSGAVTGFQHAVTGEPRALAVGHGRLYVGGRLTGIDGQSVANLAAFSLTTGGYDSGWRAGVDDVVDGITSDTNRIYLGGKFGNVNGVAGTAKLAAVDPATGVPVPGFAPNVGVLVYSIALGPTGVYVAMGGEGGRVISFSTSGSQLWQATTDGDVQAVGYLNGVVYLGGHYDNACSSPNVGYHGACLDGSAPRVKLSAVDAGTGTLLPWNPQGNGIHGVHTIAVNPGLGKVAAGGEFTTLHGARWPRLAQFG